MSYIVILDSKTLTEASQHIKENVLKSLNGSKIANYPVNFTATKDFMQKLNSNKASKYMSFISSNN